MKTLNVSQDELRKLTPQGSLSINEIFYSVQGEGRFCGTPMVFVRTNICHVGCKFCDTMYTWRNVSHNTFYTPQQLLEKVKEIARKCKHICFTGGEPLEQQESLIETIKVFKDAGLKVHLETSGHYLIPTELTDLCFWVVCSPKRFDSRNFAAKIDEIKIVNDFKDRDGNIIPLDKNIDFIRRFVSKFDGKIWVSIQPVEPKPSLFGNPTGLSEDELKMLYDNIDEARKKEESEWIKSRARAVEIVLETGWQLSAQLHKYLKIR